VSRHQQLPVELGLEEIDEKLIGVADRLGKRVRHGDRIKQLFCGLVVRRRPLCRLCHVGRDRFTLSLELLHESGSRRECLLSSTGSSGGFMIAERSLRESVLPKLDSEMHRCLVE